MKWERLYVYIFLALDMFWWCLLKSAATFPSTKWKSSWRGQRWEEPPLWSSTVLTLSLIHEQLGSFISPSSEAPLGAYFGLAQCWIFQKAPPLPNSVSSSRLSPMSQGVSMGTRNCPFYKGTCHLTESYTWPSCVRSNIGEKHVPKLGQRDRGFRKFSQFNLRVLSEWGLQVHNT